ncbi:MAG: terminase small subunit [Janthinobacterium lividum]
MADLSPDDEIQENGFTVKQQRFIEEFCVDGNCTQAAKRAGYSPASAYSIGSENLKKPEIRAAIDERLHTLALGPTEVIKQISEIAQDRLNKYLQVVTRTRTPKIEQGLGDAIDALQAELDFERKYTQRSLTVLQLNGDELKEYNAERNRVHKKLQLQIIRFELLLEENPDAVHEIDGPPEEYEDVRVNMVALAKAEEGGRIKSLSFTEFGPKVELYGADTALRDLARMHGLYEKDNRQAAGTDVEITIGGSAEKTEA